MFVFVTFVDYLHLSTISVIKTKRIQHEDSKVGAIKLLYLKATLAMNSLTQCY